MNSPAPKCSGAEVLSIAGERNVRKFLLRVTVPLGVVLAVVFALFLVNQTAQLVALADRVSPVLGTIVLWTLVCIYGICLLFPAYFILRLPKPLVPPPSESSAEFHPYIERLRLRLQRSEERRVGKGCRSWSGTTGS